MGDRRTATKLIRLHPEELRQITECARRSGLTPARFIRETALGAKPRARPHAATGPLLRELARIGRCLRPWTDSRKNREDVRMGTRGSRLSHRSWQATRPAHTVQLRLYLSCSTVLGTITQSWCPPKLGM